MACTVSCSSGGKSSNRSLSDSSLGRVANKESCGEGGSPSVGITTAAEPEALSAFREMVLSSGGSSDKEGSPLGIGEDASEESRREDWSAAAAGVLP